MATDDKNNDPEQDDFFGDDDDDFGLPELEYEALDDDDDSDSGADETSSEETDSTVEEEDIFSSDMDADTEDEVSDEDLDIPDDFDDIPDQISDEELEAAMDDEISDEELNEFYEEESFDEFEASDSDESTEMTDSVFDSDGLGDDDDFKAFDEEAPSYSEDAADNTPSFPSEDSNQAKSKFSRLVVMGIVIFLALGVSFLFIYRSFLAEDEKPVAAKVEKKPVVKKPVEEPVEEEPKEVVSKPVEETQPAATPKRTQANSSSPGTVNALTERTGYTYVIVASFLDEDMATDYANDLAIAGKSPSVIPPFGNAKTTRVAISSYPSLADAQVNVESFKTEYGPNVWLLKY